MCRYRKLAVESNEKKLSNLKGLRYLKKPQVLSDELTDSTPKFPCFCS